MISYGAIWLVKDVVSYTPQVRMSAFTAMLYAGGPKTVANRQSQR